MYVLEVTICENHVVYYRGVQEDNDEIWTVNPNDAFKFLDVHDAFDTALSVGTLINAFDPQEIAIFRWGD